MHILKHHQEVKSSGWKISLWVFTQKKVYMAMPLPQNEPLYLTVAYFLTKCIYCIHVQWMAINNEKCRCCFLKLLIGRFVCRSHHMQNKLCTEGHILRWASSNLNGIMNYNFRVPHFGVLI